MKTVQGAQGFSWDMAHTEVFIQILIADKTHCTVTLVTQQNAKFSFSLVRKHEGNGISSTFHLCGEYEELISIRVEILRICLTSPDLPFSRWPTSPAYKREMRWGIEEQSLARELCPITSSLFSFFFLTNTVCWTKRYAPWQGIWTSGYRPGFS